MKSYWFGGAAPGREGCQKMQARFWALCLPKRFQVCKEKGRELMFRDD